MSYGRTTYRSRRRLRVRTPITLLLLVAVLVGAGWFGVKQLRTTHVSAPPPKAVVCTPVHVVAPKKGARVAAAMVTVNVYNAGTVAGLADRTAAALQQRGFTIGAVANDPKNSKFAGTIMVRGAARQLPSVKLLLAQQKGAIFVKVARKNDTVDLVIGSGFQALTTPYPKSIPLVRTEVTFPAGC